MPNKVVYDWIKEGIKNFKPNDKTHPEFGQALRWAQAKGLNILVYDSQVQPDSIKIGTPIPMEI